MSEYKDIIIIVHGVEVDPSQVVINYIMKKYGKTYYSFKGHIPTDVALGSNTAYFTTQRPAANPVLLPYNLKNNPTMIVLDYADVVRALIKSGPQPVPAAIPPLVLEPRKAHEFLERGAAHMKDRAAQRDSEDGERSMLATVNAFNALEGTTITEVQGWRFMCLLKLSRASKGDYTADDYEDLAAYAGLCGEAAYTADNKK